MLKVWNLLDGEPMPVFDKGRRMMRAANLGHTMAAKGHDIVWWCSTWSHYEKFKYINHDYEYEVEPGFHVKMLDVLGYQRNISLSRLVHYTLSAFKFLRHAKYMEKPDIIITAIPSIELSYAAVKFGKENNIPVLIDFRDRWPDLFVEAAPKLLQPFVKYLSYYQTWLMKRLCRDASGFIAISEPYLTWAADYAKREVDSKRDFVFPLVAPLKTELSTDGLAEYFKQKNVTFDGKYTLVFAGSMRSTAVDLKPLMLAMKQLPGEMQFVVAGNAAGNIRDEREYRRLAETIHNVHLVGWLDAAQLNYLYQNADLAVAPYLNKGYFSMNLTNKPIEYLSYGLPILTSVKGYLSDLLVSNNAGYYYDSSDIFAIKERIRRLCEDKLLYRSVSESALKLYHDRFQYDVVLEGFLSHLAGMASEGRCKYPAC